MPELELAPAPRRPELLRLLRAALGELDPELRWVAQDLLGAGLPIDLVGVDASGRAALGLLEGPGGDLELLGRGLVQSAWVEARLGDWAQLAPQLGIRPEAGIRLWLLAGHFRDETRAAARSLGSRAPRLACYRCVRQGSALRVLLEPLSDEPAPDGSPAADARPQADPAAPPFRSGLSEAELALTPEERAEFETA